MSGLYIHCEPYPIIEYLLIKNTLRLKIDLIDNLGGGGEYGASGAPL